MHSDQVTRYLLGQLPEGEMQRLNALQESDENFRQRVRMIEDDLIECFVKGQLQGVDLMRFRRYFLAAPANRERVKIAQGFLDELNVFQAGRAAPLWLNRLIPASWQDAWQIFRQSHQLDTAWAAGSGRKFWELAGEPLRFVMQGLALVLFAICLFLLGESGWLKYKQVTLQAAQKAAQESQSASNEGAARPPAQTRDTFGQLKTAAINPEPSAANTPANAETGTAETRSANVELQPASFTLRPASRGAEGVPEFALSPNAEDVVFQLELGRDDRASYRAELRAQPDGMRLWQSGALKARAKDFGKMLEVKVPAALLRTRAYTLKVYGTNNSGNSEEALNYSFRISKQ